MSVRFEFEGLDAFEKALVDTITKKYPEEAKKFLHQCGTELMEDAKKRTPVGTEKKAKSKRLANKWRTSKGKKRRRNNEVYVEVKNNAPHAHLIEDGHRIVGKDGSEHGFCPGVHMLRTAAERMDKSFKPKLDAWLDRVLEELKL